MLFSEVNNDQLWIWQNIDLYDSLWMYFIYDLTNLNDTQQKRQKDRITCETIHFFHALSDKLVTDHFFSNDVVDNMWVPLAIYQCILQNIDRMSNC